MMFFFEDLHFSMCSAFIPNVTRAIITINGEKFAIQSCKNCHNDVKELEHVIISKEEFHTYLQKLS